MTEYAKSTVADLRKILKDRAIPSTGLTRKQQIIDKLVEWDSENATSTQVPEAEVAEVEVDSKEKEVKADEPNKPEAAAPKDAEPEAQNQTASVDAPAYPAAEETPAQDLEVPGTAASDAPAMSSPIETQPPANASVSQTPVATLEAPPAATQLEPETTQQTTATLSRLNSDEAAEESKKRKRRSATPPLSTAEVKKKQKVGEVDGADVKGEEMERIEETQKVEETQAEAVTQQSDVRMNLDEVSPAIEKDRTKVEAEGSDAAMEVDASDEEQKPDDKVEHNGDKEHMPADEHLTSANEKLADEESTAPIDAPTTSAQPPPSPSKPPSAKDARFKSLLQPTPDAPLPSSEPLHTPTRTIRPSLHPATPALYISHLMRPIQPAVLRSHLISLSTPASSSPDASLLKTCYLDPIRTHAFAIFTSVSAASRVRSSLHDTVWPSERTRKPLFVDFVPLERVEGWIEREEEAAREHGRMGRRWKVIYENGEAVFQLEGGGGGGAGAGSAPSTQRKGSEVEAFNPPSGPRGGASSSRPDDAHAEDSAGGIHPSRRGLVQDPASAPRNQHQDASRDAYNSQPSRPQPSSTHPAKASKPDTSKAFRALEELFKFTAAKPRLYFLPVAEDIAQKRLGVLKEETSRGWKGVKESDELRRFTFEDGEVVDAGPLFRGGKAGGMGRGGGRGGGGGGHRGRGRGGW